MDTVARWTALLVTAFLAVCMVLYAFVHLPPGDPILRTFEDQTWFQDLRALDRDISRNHPLPVRYFIWVGRVVRYLLNRVRAGQQTPAAVRATIE